MDDRRNVHVRLTEEAFEGLERMCIDAGVSMTALLEAAGLYFLEGGPTRPEFIARAQQIDRERRRRRD